MENETQEPQLDAEAPEEAGRGTDTTLGHLSLGEVVIPRAFLDDPQVMQMLQQIFEAGGANLAEYTVGDPANKINPETGYPEFFKIGKLLKSVAKIALPVAAAYFAPGIGSALGSTLGASSLGAIGGAAGGGLGGLVSGGGLKGVLTGAALGGAGGYLSNGGASELLGGTSAGDFLGLGSGGSSYAPGQISSGNLSSGSALASSPSSATGGSFSSYAPVLGAANSIYSNNQAQDQLEKATKNANSQLNPYLANGAAASSKVADYLGLGGSGATAQDILASTPGYEFTRDQGIQSIDRSAAARGGLFSGAQGKALTDYATNLANTTGQQYLSNLSSAGGTGLSAANTYGNNTTALGSAGANADIATGNSISQLLATARRVTGYDPRTGQPIYA